MSKRLTRVVTCLRLPGLCFVRYQRCLQLSMPYVRRLRVAGVLRVKDLCRVDLPSWRLEPAYAKQV